jgi:prepilin-type N-terminal cleavage/methylation domain-containing protein
MIPIAPRRLGVTLIELVVVLAIIALLATMATIALGRHPQQQEPDGARAAVAALRTKAVDSRVPASGVVVRGQRAFLLTAFPDGSVAGDSALSVDRYSGRARGNRP